MWGIGRANYLTVLMLSYRSSLDSMQMLAKTSRLLLKSLRLINLRTGISYKYPRQAALPNKNKGRTIHVKMTLEGDLKLLI